MPAPPGPPRCTAQSWPEGPTLPIRLRFPEDEPRHAWLPLLLDAYYLIDQGVHVAIGRAIRQGRQLACGKGCAACCRSHLTIPVYPLEVMGIYWFASERMAIDLRALLRDRLAGYRRGQPCPFLVAEQCSIHPLRPAACRQFNVLDRVCAEGEDAFYTRRGDVVTPAARYTDAAFDRMLPFYGIRDKRERHEAVKQGRLHALAQVLQEVDWTRLAARLPGADGGCGVVRQ